MNSSMYQNDDNETAVQPSLSAVADPTVWGHAFYGDAMACAASVAACTGHKRPMVRGIPGTMWPCYSARDASTMTDQFIAVKPIKVGLMLGVDRPTAMHLVGYIGDQVCSWPVPAVMAGTNTRHVGRHANQPTCH
ncbi:unnamed protein product, partial [Adineta steineri]